MKRVLVVCTVLVLLVAVGIAIFVATFDLDRYRPQLVSQLQQALGRPVTLEHISLGWHGGVAMELQGLTIYEDAQARLEPLLRMDAASALVQLFPLLRKEVHVSSVMLQHPQIRIARDAQGHVNLVGLMAAASPAAAPSAGSHPTEPAASKGPVTIDIASLVVVDGTLHWTDAMAQPATDLWVKGLNVRVKNIALGRPMDVMVDAALAGTTPNLHLSGRLTPPGPTTPGSVEQVVLSVEGVPIEQFLPTPRADEPQVRGRLTLRVSGGVTSLGSSQWLRALSGSGRLQLNEPVIANLNLLRAVFERFSMLPGLVEMLQQRLPVPYQQKLSAKDTVFAPIDVSIHVEAGTLRFDNLSLRTDTFGLSGAGSISLQDMGFEIRSILQVDPTLSSAMIHSVTELKALANRDGAIELPVMIQGQGARVAVRPDINYVASKVLTTSATDLLDRALRRLNKGAPAQPADASPAAQPAAPAEGTVLDQFLQRALERKR